MTDLKKKKRERKLPWSKKKLFILGEALMNEGREGAGTGGDGQGTIIDNY